VLFFAATLLPMLPSVSRVRDWGPHLIAGLSLWLAGGLALARRAWAAAPAPGRAPGGEGARAAA
jgi:hypothetical protein